MKHLIYLLFLPLAISLTFADVAEDQIASLKEHFPDGLLNADGQPVDVDALKGKAIGIYFSAAWCGPCRTFSPQLKKFREDYKDQFDVVFVSSDRSPEEQKKYMAKAGMCDYTLKLKSPAATALSKKYKVSGIPTLVLLKSNGDFLTRDGRSLISSGVDGSRIGDPNVSLKTESEEYTCNKCTKIHTRQIVKGLEILAASE